MSNKNDKTDGHQLWATRHDGGDGYGLDLELDEYADECRLAREDEITLAAMVEMLDRDAEDRNAHDFVQAHLSLAALLKQEVGEEATKKIFRRISKLKGLHGIQGVCGCGDRTKTEDDLGIRL